MGHLEGLTEDRLGGLKVARRVAQMADRLEDLKVARTEDRSGGQWAALTADRLGGLKEALMADRLEDRTEDRTEDRSGGQWEGRMEAQTVDQLRDQEEEWAEGLAPRRQERESVVLQARSQAPLASA